MPLRRFNPSGRLPTWVYRLIQLGIHRKNFLEKLPVIQLTIARVYGYLGILSPSWCQSFELYTCPRGVLEEENYYAARPYSSHIWPSQRMRLSIQHPLIQIDYIKLAKDQVKVLECLRQPETLHGVDMLTSICLRYVPQSPRPNI